MFPISSHIRKWHHRHPQPSTPHHIFSHICISLPVIKVAYALNWTGLFRPFNRRSWRGGKSPNQYTESLDTHLVMHCLICSKKCEERAQLCLRLDSDASCCHCQVGAAVRTGNGPVWGLQHRENVRKNKGWGWKWMSQSKYLHFFPTEICLKTHWGKHTHTQTTHKTNKESDQ